MKTRPEKFEDIEDWRKGGDHVFLIPKSTIQKDNYVGDTLRELIDRCREDDKYAVIDYSHNVEVAMRLTEDEKAKALESSQNSFDFDTRCIKRIQAGEPVDEWKVEYALEAAKIRGIDDLPEPIIIDEGVNDW